MTLGRNTVHWLLAVSLALNLFMGGLYLGRMLFGDHRHGSHVDRGDAFTLRLELRALESALGEEGRAALRESMRARSVELGPRFEAIRKDRDRVTAALAADPFQSGELALAFEQLNRSLAALQEPLQQTILDAAGKMQPEERRQMADALEAMRADINRRYAQQREVREKREGEDR